jgi:hypothetical protein
LEVCFHPEMRKPGGCRAEIALCIQYIAGVKRGIREQGLGISAVSGVVSMITIGGARVAILGFRG